MTFTTSNDVTTIARRLSALESSVRTLRASIPRSIAGLTFPADSKDPFWAGSSDGDVTVADFDAAMDCALTLGAGTWCVVGFAEIGGATTETGVNIGIPGEAERPGVAGQCVALNNGSGAVASASLIQGPGQVRAVRYVKGAGVGVVNQVRLVAFPVNVQD